MSSPASSTSPEIACEALRMVSRSSVAPASSVLRSKVRGAWLERSAGASSSP
ncbi:MAG: hypothetical protein IPF99_13580 [Deltaproteobacteria bacterium]|nr:hypothetical protein [Deltaproteobacteria bacterium]